MLLVAAGTVVYAGDKGMGNYGLSNLLGLCQQIETTTVGGCEENGTGNYFNS